MENTVDDGRNRHGFPRGYHFAPHDLELIRLLDDQLAGRKLPDPLPNIFHHVRIRDFHPADLHEEYKEHKEARYIYFFDHREYRTAGRRPARATTDGGWKASGGGKKVMQGGGAVGFKLTMVFYEKEEHPGGKADRKTQWALHEYTRIIGPDDKVADLALYRLYKKIPARGAPAEVEALPAQCATAGGTSTAKDHQYVHSAMAAAAPGPSNWMVPAAAVNPLAGGCMGRQGAVNHVAGIAGWDNTPPPMPPSLPPVIAPPIVSAVAHGLPMSAVAHGLPWLAHSSCSETTDSNNVPLPTPAAGLADKLWCETKQAASPCNWFPMPYDNQLPDLPMLMDENDPYSCSVEHLMALMEDGSAARATWMPDTNQDDMAAPAQATWMPDSNQDDMAAPAQATLMPDTNQDDTAVPAPATSMPDTKQDDTAAPAPATSMLDTSQDDTAAPATMSAPDANRQV